MPAAAAGKDRAGRRAPLLTALLVAGCAVGPDFHSPAAPGIARYTEGETPSVTVGAATRCGRRRRSWPQVGAFWVLMLISLAAVPLALALRTVELRGPAL
jgi:hypothetical protein